MVDSVKNDQNKKSSTKKKGLSYVSITSQDTKLNIITKINNIVEKYNLDNSVCIGVIQTNPTPNISFWVDDVEQRCGMTITSESSKWGWSYNYNNNCWNTCQYMSGTGFDKFVLSEDENMFLTKILIDCCIRYNYPKEIARRNGLLK